MKSEFEFIQSLRNRISKIRISHSAFRIGVGDDCAVVPKDSKTDLVITTDLLVEDVDFRLKWTKPEFLGHKALAISLSDVAAMGAKPVWAMLSIGVPEKIWKTDFTEKFYDGWFELAKKFNVQLAGGDVSKTPDKIVIDSIAAGEVKKGKAVLRSGAKPNDLIFVTGNLGGASAGLKLLESGEKFEKSKYKNLLLRQLKPEPRIKIGQILSKVNLATAMIDLSDGLSSDLMHLCRESKTGARIFAERIPTDKSLGRFLTQRRKDAKGDVEKEENKPQMNASERRLNVIANQKRQIEDLFFALHGGEDFELLFTVNPKKKFLLEKELRDFPFTCIGEITKTTDKFELISNSETTILKPEGFRHF